MKLMATNNYVVLKLRPKIANRGLIALPDRAKEDDDFCEVVDIGPGVVQSKEGYHYGIGDLVLRPTGLYEWHDEENDEHYLVVEDKDICAVGVKD